MARYEFKWRFEGERDYGVFQMEFEQSRIEQLKKKYGNEIEAALMDIAENTLKKVHATEALEVVDLVRVV